MPQLSGRVIIAPDADLVAVIKPQFELGLRQPAADERGLVRAVEAASAGVAQAR